MKGAVEKQTIVNSKRLWEDLMAIAEFTLPDHPFTRRSFSDLFIDGRRWLREKFQSAGFEVRTDDAGNLIGRIPGSAKHARTIMLGSHSDTVPGGGRFDGVAGVIAALEIGRALVESGYKPKHHIEVVDFLAEEPSEYGLSCVGSRGISGWLDEKMLAYTAMNGETLSEAIKRVGGKPERIKDAKRGDIAAFYELHIEQGPILERESIEIGLVTAIVGIRRLELIFTGEEDHAGTTPMEMRRDAAAAAAETVVAMRKLAEAFSRAGRGHFVATAGIVEVQPGAANVVPCQARVIIDARAEDRDLMETFHFTLDNLSREIAAGLRVEREVFRVVSDSVPTICDAHLRDLLRKGAEAFCFTHRELASGAGHDAAFAAKVGPAAMVFVPCRKGKSHSSEEWADEEALAKGANTLTHAIKLFDQAEG